MKTTELFVEQVLIGVLVLLVAGLVFWNSLHNFLSERSEDWFELVVTGGLVIGTAYLIGMVYDRIADTLLQHLESHCRLQFALARFKVKGKEVKGENVQGEEVKGEVFDHYTVPHSDPFTEGKYRIMVLGNSDATSHMEYLRSRIRLTRATATLIPGLMVALLLALDKGKASAWWTIVALTIPIVYAVTLSLKVMKPRKNFYRPPKTYQLKEVKKYMERARMVPADPRLPEGWHILRLIAYDEVWIALLTLAVAGTTLVLSTGNYARLSVVVTGLVVTIVVGWTWWRISMTFYSFVRDYATYGVGKPPA